MKLEEYSRSLRPAGRSLEQGCVVMCRVSYERRLRCLTVLAGKETKGVAVRVACCHQGNRYSAWSVEAFLASTRNLIQKRAQIEAGPMEVSRVYVEQERSCFSMRGFQLPQSL